MKLKLYIQRYKGFTMLEALVAMSLMTIIMGMTVSSILSHKNLYSIDLARTRMNQDIRGVVDILGSQIRLTGENLPSIFGALILLDGVVSPSNPNGSDILTIRRNLLDESLKLCETINAGTTETDIKFTQSASTVSPTAGCAYSANEDNYLSWKEYYDSRGGDVYAYMYNINGSIGEYFKFNQVKDQTNYYRIRRKSGTGNWINSYSINNGVMYVLEDWQVSIDDGVLQILQNEDTTSILKLANNISDFQVELEDINGNILTSFAESDDWSNIASIKVTVSAEDTVGSQTIDSSWSGEYVIRNVMSVS